MGRLRALGAGLVRLEQPESNAHGRRRQPGALQPEVRERRGVATRPRGVRSSSPHWSRNGSYTSSTVSGASPTATASVAEPDRAARRTCGTARRGSPRSTLSRPSSSTSNSASAARAVSASTRPSAAHLGVVAHALQQPVRDARRAAGSRTRSRTRRRRRARTPRIVRGAAQDRGELVDRRSSRGGRRSRSGRAAGR